MAVYKVVEKFLSINGEGSKAGELACFIRFAGCDLNCSYCDTRWANDADVAYEEMSEGEIYEYIKSLGVENVTLTGGEPLIQKDIHRLLDYLAEDSSLNIEIETNGAVDLSAFMDLPENIVFTMDYKLPGSRMEDMMCLSNLEIIRHNDCVKFVISNETDMNRATEIVRAYNLLDKTRVYFSTAFGEITPADVVEYMKHEGLNKVKLQLQLHKYIWAPEKRGV